MTHFAKIGGAIQAVGALVVAASQTLPDTMEGSPRAVGTAVGMAVVALGAVFIALGKYEEAHVHG